MAMRKRNVGDKRLVTADPSVYLASAVDRRAWNDRWRNADMAAFDPERILTRWLYPSCGCMLPGQAVERLVSAFSVRARRRQIKHNGVSGMKRKSCFKSGIAAAVL